MKEIYEINKHTNALIHFSKKQTKVYEEDKEFIINQTPTEIIDYNCKFFGSSFQGRAQGTKAMVGYNYKAPIIIEETSKIIFFPTKSPRLKECSWISLNNIKKHEKDKKDSKIIFVGEIEVNIPITYGSLDNQILRSNKLWCELEKNHQKMSI